MVSSTTRGDTDAAEALPEPEGAGPALGDLPPDAGTLALHRPGAGLPQTRRTRALPARRHRCGTIDIAALARDRDQLWAEAVHRFRAGAIWWIDDPALLAEAREEQDRRYQSDAWDDLIEHWLTHEIRTVSDGFPDYGNSRTESVPRPEPLADVSVGEILEEAIGLEPARWTRGDQMRVSAYLKANGWERYRRRDEGGREAPREWRYRRGQDRI